ncbi:MAG: hypothetical protein IPP91_17110 [Betaproteobacteria bacterium]|nr:hypothetical protein [Betaproteobacteria bacterium]
MTWPRMGISPVTESRKLNGRTATIAPNDEVLPPPIRDRRDGTPVMVVEPRAGERETGGDVILRFALPAGKLQPKRDPIEWDPAQPYRGLDSARWRLRMAAPGSDAAVWALAPRIVPVVTCKFAFISSKTGVRKDWPVTLEFTSPEVAMGFSAPEFKVRTDIIPVQVARLTFTPDKTGTFVFLCDVFCGEGREGMSGELVVA